MGRLRRPLTFTVERLLCGAQPLETEGCTGSRPAIQVEGTESTGIPAEAPRNFSGFAKAVENGRFDRDLNAWGGAAALCQEGEPQVPAKTGR